MSRARWVLAAALAAASACARVEAGPSVTLPAPAVDEARAAAKDQKMAVFAGGDEATARYEIVSSGETRHAESVQVIYDPSVVTYGELLQIFFSVAHDPTQWNRQGPDDGPQYRSAIFAANGDQEHIARAYIAQLDAAAVFRAPIVTQVSALEGFYPAEEEHQDFARRDPDNAYIRIHDAPKVEALRKVFPERYR